MITFPWIILMTDRTRLGAPVYAVGRSKRPTLAGRIRRTLKVENALRFETRRKAENFARKLLDRTHFVLFTVVRVAPGDFAFNRPKGFDPASVASASRTKGPALPLCLFGEGGEA